MACGSLNWTHQRNVPIGSDVQSGLRRGRPEQSYVAEFQPAFCLRRSSNQSELYHWGDF
jgi:hypothetical protein